MKDILKKSFLYVFIAVIFIGFFYSRESNSVTKSENIPYKQLETTIQENQNKDIKMFQYEDGKIELQAGKTLYITQANPNDNDINKILNNYEINYHYIKEKNYFGNILNWVIAIAFLFFIISIFSNQNRALKKTEEMAKENNKTSSIPDVKLNDVGGLSEETRREIEQIIEIFNHKEEAKVLGIKPPKGAILYGPPGTGKTLLAKAVANALQANFYSVGGSSFIEMFVGVGAKRVRELFQEARKNKPALIFIDEIDAVAGKRGNAHRNEERENTLNELLKQLDGTEGNENIFVIAATNRFDILDEALVRPGRFDYKIFIGLPDVEGRKEIIKIHQKDKPLNNEIKEALELIAHSTTGFSGAEIEALFMIAANNALSLKRKEITMDDINFALDRIALGNQGRRMNDENTKKRVAYHEAGHALVGVVTKPGSVRKATIIPRGDALGFVAPVPKEMDLSTKSELIDRIKMILAGGVAEMKIFGEHSIGVGGDVQQAKNIIEKMVELGMKDNDFVLIFDEKEKNKEMQKIYEAALQGCKEIVNQYEEQFHKLTTKLLEKETLSGEEIEEIVLGIKTEKANEEALSETIHDENKEIIGYINNSYK